LEDVDEWFVLEQFLDFFDISGFSFGFFSAWNIFVGDETYFDGFD